MGAGATAAPGPLPAPLLASDPSPDDSETPVLRGPWPGSHGDEIAALDRSTLRVLFEEQRAPLFRFLYRLTGNAADADDLLQDTFLMAWRKRSQFAGRGSAAGYLRTIAYRVFLNARQRIVRREGLWATADREPEAAPPAEAELERAEASEFLFDRVREALSSLSDEMREAFVLFRFEHLTCVQIAEAAGIPVKTVESRVRRATLHLAEKLAPHRQNLPLSR